MAKKTPKATKSSKKKGSKAARELAANGQSEVGLPSGYGPMLSDLKARVRSARLKAAVSVNSEMILLYWGIGREILRCQSEQGWGAKVIDRLSNDLRAEFPDMGGLSRTNLRYMRALADAYPDERIVQQLAGQIPWFHSCLLLDRVKDPKAREWYIRKTIEHGWSRSILTVQIESKAHERVGKAITNFERTLPPEQSDLAHEILKDPYTFDFITLADDAVERDLERGLVYRPVLLSITLWVVFLASTAFAENHIPRVLILGDSIYGQPANEAAKMLKGRVDVVYQSAGEVHNTSTGLASLDEVLGETKWNLIHFNFGLGDLIYRAPGMKSFRALPREAGGVRTTHPEQYEKNLHELVKRLKATGAGLVWASTTPIRGTARGILEIGSEVEYNAIAARVMTEHDVPINDIHTHVTGMLDKMKRPGSDPFSFKATPFDAPIVRSILTELNLMRPVAGPVKIFVMVGGWSHIGGGIVVDLSRPRPGQNSGTLDDLVLNEKTAASYRHLLNNDGTWATRTDVWIQFDRRSPSSGTLRIGYGGNYKRGIGSELALGHVLGDHFDEQVLIMKTTLGTPALTNELRPPSSGQTGKAYTQLVQQVRNSLGALQYKFPDYTDDAGCEFSGLILNLGEQDKDATLYAEYLPKLINDLRKDLGVSNLPVVIVGTGRGGRAETDFPEIIKAQQSVAALPQFKETVSYVETRDFWPPENARDAFRHPAHERWYDNAESFCKMGKAAGEGMLKLLKLSTSQ